MIIDSPRYTVEQRGYSSRIDGNGYLQRFISVGVGKPTTGAVTPRDAPRGHAPGRDPDRVLVLGAGAAVGWGVATNELALPGALARTVSKITQRGCDVDLLAAPEMNIEAAALAVDGRDLLQYDAIVLMIGVVEALRLTATHRWASGMSELLTTLTGKLPVTSSILVVGVNPIKSLAAPRTRVGRMRSRRALALDQLTLELCEGDPRTTFLSLPGRSVTSSSSAKMSQQYEEWATVISDVLAPRLNAQNQLDHDRRKSPRREIDEHGSQAAVDELQLHSQQPSANLQRILSWAQQAFTAESALVAVLDHERQWHFARVGKALVEAARSESFYEFAIQGDDVLVVPDTRDDERFRNFFRVAGDAEIRFYAGFPIESASGHRIGTLCVLDSHPRRRTGDIEMTLLRQLSHFAQKEMWKHIPRESA